MTAMAKPLLLLIENDPQFIYLIERYGKMSGCRIACAVNIEEAMIQIRQEVPNILLLNLMLPPSGGLPVLHALKQDNTSAELPVAVYSSLADEVTAWEGGGDFFIPKPVMYNDFLSMLVATGTIPPQTVQNQSDIQGEVKK
jgi:DNA-binding response OmpR family regulator